MEPLHRVHAGDDPLRQPVHDTAGSPEYCIRQNAAACAPRLATTAAPGPRDHDDASPRCRAHLVATLRQRRESQDAAAAPFYRGATLRQRRDSASSPRPTTPASPRRPRRRRGTTARRGCGAARSSPPTGRGSLDETEADAGPISSPVPGDGRLGEDGLRDHCRVRRRLHGDASPRCVRATAAGCVGDGVKDLAGAPLQRGGDIRRSLSAEPDDSTSNGEDSARGNDSEDQDNDVTVVRGVLKKAAADVFLGGVNRSEWLPRLRLAVELGPTFWLQELIHWLKGSPRDRMRDIWSWHGVVGRPIEQNDDTCAICGTLVCLEARHRLDFERRHGFNTFPYHIPAETVDNLKNLCSERGVWTKYGADERKVLELIQEAGGVVAAGVPGWNPCSLQVKSWKYHRNSTRQPMPEADIAKLIYTEGPILGGMVVDKSYYAPGWENRVYRGVPRNKGGGPHLVVCTAYYKQPAPQRHWPDKTELIIVVVDNHDWDGPVRWILATAFTGFFEVQVEPLDVTELRVKKPSLWRRLLNTVSRQHRL